VNPHDLWKRYEQYLCRCESVGLSLDVSRMSFPDAFLADMEEPARRAFDAMDALEGGAIANPDENRMVGHYWLRAPDRAPSAELRTAIESTRTEIKRFAADVHAGKVRPPQGRPFKYVVICGIGGSALGPQFVSDALGSPCGDPMQIYFCDNTDPDGIDRVLNCLGDHLHETLTVVMSKSGSTPETRNSMIEIMQAYAARDLCFGDHAIAVTQDGSELHEVANKGKWIRSFPMWDWVGGRTSQLSAVGLLPAALQGVDIDGLLDGARRMDECTRAHDVRANPAALMALMWHYAGNGHGEKDLVIIPYKDRLALLSRYLQQLIMESLGKEKDLDGRVVNQGLTVYGNKGSTDQHAYIQQLREGIDNFFVTFVEVLCDRQGPSVRVEPHTTSGDYLAGFLLGTRAALFEAGRESMTITIERVDAVSVGALIALFERAVGLYASLININAYHQPGVQAGKLAARQILDRQLQVIKYLGERRHTPETAEQVAAGIGAPEDIETVFHILEHLAANPDRKFTRRPGATPFDGTYAAD
jgi:glucose-6-phosphate isomerase